MAAFGRFSIRFTTFKIEIKSIEAKKFKMKKLK